MSDSIVARRQLVHVQQVGWLIRTDYQTVDGEVLPSVEYTRPTTTNLRLRIDRFDPPCDGQGVLAGPHPKKPVPGHLAARS